MRVHIFTMQFRRVLAVLTACLVLAVSGFGAVRAQQQQQGGSGLQVSPTRTELTIPPGEVKDFDVVVKNVTKGPVSVKTFLNDFDADGITGEPKLVVDESKPRSPSSLKPFLKGIADFELRAGESKQVKLSVDIPNDTGAGGYYGAVRFVALPPGQREIADRQVALNASVASLVLVEVEGNIIEQIQINTIEVRKDDKPGSFFFSKPNKLAVDIQNKGNSFSKPFGRVQITGMNGKEVFSYEINNKDPRGNILPQSSRLFVDGLSGIKSPGRYKAIVNVSHGSGGEVITSSVTFWYVPVWIILVLLVLILLIAGYVYLNIRRRGRTHRRR
jgi:hypothetical protein